MNRISPTLFNLIKILNDLESHSGEALGEVLNISRNAVWKHINQLIKYGIGIRSQRSIGYQLNEPVILLEKAKIQFFQNSSSAFVSPLVGETGLWRQLKDREGLTFQERPLNPENPIVPGEIEIFGSISSTNDQVRSLPKPKVGELQCCLAEHQTQGRGRFERVWVSPFGANLMLSARVFINQDMSSLGGLSLCISLAILETLKFFKIDGALCKWPNDILYQGEKLAGVLIEAYAENYGATELVIGIGLNITMLDVKAEAFSKPWTSMQKILGSVQERSQIAGVLIRNLSFYLGKFMTQGFESFQEEWAKYDLLKEKMTTLSIGDNKISGIARGVNSSGHLLLEHADKSLKAYSAGEASVSGMPH
jgi:BirA family biotin operon repressor/biotin-[acetyl-CoA-carboxylase] ligase